MDGIVISWNRARGFGFVHPLRGGGPEDQGIFCHATSLPRGIDSLPIGSRISFVLADSKRGVQCARVRLLTVAGAALPKHERVRRYEDTDL